MSVVDDYLANVAEPQRSKLEEVRRTIAGIAPNATEGISYGMPVFKQNGTYLIGFAAFKDHMSLFPGAEAIEVFASQLKDFKLSKGTIQFTLDRPVPKQLLEGIVRSRLKSIGS